MDAITILTTEQRNEKSMNIHSLTTSDIVYTINNDDLTVAERVRELIPVISTVVDQVENAFNSGGRLFYVGAGTSGRVGVVDAVECPPTCSTSYEMVQAVMAGGSDAFVKAVEGAEDSEELGAQNLKDRKLNERDIVIGIAASGRTPFVIGALKYAKEIGAKSVSLSSNENAKIDEYADVSLNVVTGPELLTGSTRMKAATAHKLILNMISTGAMIKIGKIYENLMVDVKLSNKKLLERGKNIIMTTTGVSYKQATKYLKLSDNEVKTAIVMIKADVSYEEAKELLEETKGFVKHAIELKK